MTVHPERMKPNRVRLSVILPSFLEEENLRLLLPRINASVSAVEDRFEVIVVDTVVPLDNTKEACRLHGAHYVNRKGGDEFGKAVRTGIGEARGEYILFMDADGSHPPEFIPSLYCHKDDFDVVIASRYVEGGYTENTPLLVWMSRALNFTYSTVLGIPCKDFSNSFRLYRAGLLKEIDLYCDHFDIVEEILIKIFRKRNDAKIREVPFSFKQRMFGKSKRNLFAFAASYLFTLLRLRFGK